MAFLLNLSIKTYAEACDVVAQWGILPLSGFIPDHPSLDSITADEAWHTGTATDPWLWRDRFAGDGIAAYGRFIGDKPLLVSRDIFPLVRCLLYPGQTVEGRYAAGTLSKPARQMYAIVQENDGIDVRTLRAMTDMQQKSAKSAFDRALIELQNAADIVISGIAERLNEHGNKSGWNSTCYTLSERWMSRHGIEALALAPEEARARLFAWIEERWAEDAVRYLAKKLRSNS